MKINDWIKCWNIALLVISVLGVISCGILGVIIYEYTHDEPVSFCAVVSLVMGLPFIGTMYTSFKFITLKQEDFSAKFVKLMKIRQYCFIHFDLVFIVSLILKIFGNDTVIPTYVGAFIIFQVLLATVDDVLYHEIKDGEKEVYYDEE